MAVYTLVDARQASNDKLTNIVIDEFIKSPLLAVLPFDDAIKAQGGQSLLYSYNRVSRRNLASGRALNTEYAGGTAATTRHTVEAKPFGGAFDIDRVIINNEVEVINHVEFQIQQVAQSSEALFHEWFLYGDSVANPLQFDGIYKEIAGSKTEFDADGLDLSTAAAIKENGGELLHMLRRAVAKMDGAPTIIGVNKDLFAAIQSVADSITQFTLTRNILGVEVINYGGATIMALGDKQDGTGPVIPVDADGLTDMFLFRLGMDGVHAVAPEGGYKPQVNLPNMNEVGAVKRGEIEMVASAVMKSTTSAALIKGIKAVDVAA